MIHTSPARPPLLSSDPDELSRLWFMLPKPQPNRGGWLVFSHNFLLELLQKCYGHPERIRRTLFWNVVLVPVIVSMAVLQALVMIASYLPVVDWFMSGLVQFFGRNYLGFSLRSCYWKSKLKRLGQDTLIDRGVEIWHPEAVEIGHNCYLSRNVLISAGGNLSGETSSIVIGDYTFVGPLSMLSGHSNIRIGDFVGISGGVHIYSACNAVIHPQRRGLLISMSHRAPSDRQHILSGPVEIEDYVFLSGNVIVEPNARLGRGAIVHPFTDVKGTFPPFANVVGPGRARQNGWRRPLELDPCHTSQVSSNVSLSPG